MTVTVAVSASDIITFAKGATNVADTIGEVIDTVSDDLVLDINTFLGINDVEATSNSIVQGVLPHNDLLSGKAANEYRYLKSRDAALLNTLRAHLSTQQPLADKFESLADDKDPDDGDFAISSSGVFTFDTDENLKFECDGEPTVIDCTTCGAGPGAGSGGEFCVYGAADSNTGAASESDLLIPPSARPTIGAYDATLSEVANDVPEPLKQQDNANVSTVLSLVAKNNYLVQGVTGDEWLTVFAPNEDAVTTLVTTLDGEVTGFTIDGAALKTFLTWNDYLTGNVLKGHVVKGSATPTWSEDLPTSGLADITTVLSELEEFDGIIQYDSSDETLKPKTNASDLEPVEPTIKVPNVYTKDAVVHVIGNFLLTSGQVTRVVDALKRASLADAVAANTKLVEYVGKASGAIGTQLGKDVQQTLFAPVNSAFDKLSEEQGEYLEDNQDELDKVLKAHVFTEVYFAKDSGTAANEEEVTLTDLNNSEIKCTKEKCTINGSEVTLKNLRTTRYGVVYDIESVIVPSDVELPSSATTMTTTIAAFMLSAMAAIALVF